MHAVWLPGVLHDGRKNVRLADVRFRIMRHSVAAVHGWCMVLCVVVECMRLRKMIFSLVIRNRRELHEDEKQSLSYASGLEWLYLLSTLFRMIDSSLTNRYPLSKRVP